VQAVFRQKVPRYNHGDFGQWSSAAVMRLRIGVIGLGDAWQQRHAPALRALADRFEVRAICEQVGHRAEQAAAEFDASAVESFRTVARREDIDAVLVLAHQWYGALPLVVAAEAGKAVYCTAGVEVQAEEAEQIRRCVERSGVVFMVELPRRKAPATARLKQLIAAQLGQPRLLLCHQCASSRSATVCPANRRPEYAALGEMIEAIDWCCYLVGKRPTAVVGLIHTSPTDRGRAGDEDYYMISLDFSESTAPGTGQMAQISCSRYIPAHWHEAISYRAAAALQASCQRGVAFADLPSTVVWFDEAGRHQESLDSERPLGELLLAEFYRAVVEGAAHTSDLDDLCRALHIVQQARRSHVDGRRIVLD
jgi:predicted dehydrogenase